MNQAANKVILQVALTFDHDAISSDVEKGHLPFDRSIGEFGPRVGLPRILQILARESVPATFFVPVHTAHTWPDSLAAIVAGGHEVGCHGWAHEDHALLPADNERDLIVRQKAALTAAAHAAGYTSPVVGFRAPYWSLSEQTLRFVEEAGFTYDSSLAWEETRITPVRHGDTHTRQNVQPWGPTAPYSRHRSATGSTTGPGLNRVAAAGPPHHRAPSPRSPLPSCAWRMPVPKPTQPCAAAC